MSAILQFNIACRISLFQICTQCFGSIFCYITAIVYADQFGILIYQLGDHITGHLYHIGANGYNTLITDTHEVILLDLLVIDHGITYRIGNLAGLDILDLTEHGLFILFHRKSLKLSRIMFLILPQSLTWRFKQS